ncbi:ABC transporter permease [Rufibacter glacialis]|uniref:ABC transporter permease n=1 Tax=Rufibacter glacialis TaxID=1259555 RepID=A0A5M8Q9Y7_9BACT|nr:ABC transporter permease subunit [Rufibacter glacialis]KAA6431754.1 ABC transporter permease [Rufibacter glacialis]
MGKEIKKRTFTRGEKLSLTWFLLFSGAALAAQAITLFGQEPQAHPERAFLPPFTSVAHLLGTDHLGRDLLFYLLLSCRTAWLLAIPPLSLATLLGVVAGTSAAILGNSGLKVSLWKILVLLFLGFLYFYFKGAVNWAITTYSLSYLRYGYEGVLVFLLFLLWGMKVPKGLKRGKNEVAIPIEGALLKIINIWSTLPKLLLLLILSAFTPFSLYSLMGWICVTYWVLPARIARASVLQLKEETYYEATRALGIPFRKVFVQFLWPSIKGPILTNFCFAASGLLGIGSTLAYLGIGIPADVPSWGKLLANARYSYEAWWIFLFPAITLLFSILSLQTLGNRFSARSTQASVTK